MIFNYQLQVSCNFYVISRFFGAYHGARMALKLYYPQTKEENIMTAAAITFPPLVIYAPLRALIPYAVMLVGLDAYNELME